MSTKLTRRMMLAALPVTTSFSIFPNLSFADDSSDEEDLICYSSKKSGNWLVHLTPIEIKPKDNPDTTILEIEHLVQYGDDLEYEETVDTPHIRFAITLTTRDNKITECKLTVSHFGFTDKEKATQNGGDLDIKYWPRYRSEDPSRISHGKHDTIYFQVVAENGQSIRFEGDLKPTARGRHAYSSLDSISDKFFVDAHFPVHDPAIANQLVYNIRKRSPLTVETGIIHSNGQRMPFWRERLESGVVDQLYDDAVSQLNNLLNSGEFSYVGCRLAEYESMQKGFNHCFLTTACCTVQARPDDCFELQTLRGFRDGWLMRQPFGKAEIARYYRTAPAISASLLGSANGRKILRRLYWGTMVPCVVLIRLGMPSMAHRLYRRMMVKLGA